MNKKALKWLYSELPGLVDSGILNSDTAARIREHYGPAPETRSARSAVLLICAILGAVLIGSGVILLLAYNWNELTRPARTVLSVVPLLASQALCGWTLMKRSGSIAWREATSGFQTLCIGAALALVAQTYNIPGDFGRYMLTWMLLAMPLIYLMKVSLPCMLYLAGIVAWGGYTRSEDGNVLAFIPLFCIVLPHIVSVTRKSPESARARLLGWTTALSLTIATGTIMEHSIPGLWIVAYAGLFAVFLGIGKLAGRHDSPFFRNPFTTWAMIATPALSLILTFTPPWEDVVNSGSMRLFGYHVPGFWTDFTVTAVLLSLAGVVIFRSWSTQDTLGRAFGLIPAIGLAGIGLTWLSSVTLPASLLFNLYVLGLGLMLLFQGYRLSKTGMLNAGMAIVSALAIARFFDSDLSFLGRGTAFIIIGAGFLAANTVMIKRLKGESR